MLPIAPRLALRRLVQINSPDFIFIAEPWRDFNIFPQIWLHMFDLKPFAFNKRHDLLPNTWCFCKSHLNPNILFVDDQYVSFSVTLNNMKLDFFGIYVFTCYIHRRNLWQNINNIISNIKTLWSLLVSLMLLLVLMITKEIIPLLAFHERFL